MAADPSASTQEKGPIEMFFENEPTRTLTLIELMLMVLIGLAPVALTIWMKLVLYRRPIAEDGGVIFDNLRHSRGQKESGERMLIENKDSATGPVSCGCGLGLREASRGGVGPQTSGGLRSD